MFHIPDKIVDYEIITTSFPKQIFFNQKSNTHVDIDELRLTKIKVD